MNSAARGNLLAALNNWALDRCADRANTPRRSRCSIEGRRLDAEHQPFLLNRRHVYRLWIESLLADGRSAEAAAVLAAAKDADRNCPLWEAYSQADRSIANRIVMNQSRAIVVLSLALRPKQYAAGEQLRQ